MHLFIYFTCHVSVCINATSIDIQIQVYGFVAFVAMLRRQKNRARDVIGRLIVS